MVSTLTPPKQTKAKQIFKQNYLTECLFGTNFVLVSKPIAPKPSNLLSKQVLSSFYT